VSVIRVEIDGDGQLDELVATGATVHVERMDGGSVWMRVDDHVVWFTGLCSGEVEATVEVDP
jgi:hypothetical protein